MGVTERLTASVTDIRDRGQRLVQLHRELLATEMKQKGRRFAAAAGLFAAAALFALYAVGFALATIAVALALVLPLWAALLIVTAVLFVLVAILALVGRSQLEDAKEPPPGRSLEEAKKSAELVRANVRDTASTVRTKVTFGRRPAATEAAEPPVSPPGPAAAVVVPPAGAATSTGTPADEGRTP